jgi:hypothetical protein
VYSLILILDFWPSFESGLFKKRWIQMGMSFEVEKPLEITVISSFGLNFGPKRRWRTVVFNLKLKFNPGIVKI